MKPADIYKALRALRYNKNALRALRYNKNALRGADLRGADLTNADLTDADLTDADLRGANLMETNLTNANLANANLIGANLIEANLTRANLTRANLKEAKLTNVRMWEANLHYANLCNADLYNTDLRDTDLTETDMSGATGLLSPISFMENYFERVPEGYIAYKTFGAYFRPNPHWKIEVGSILTETVNPNRQNICGWGINVAPLEWVAANNDVRPIYKLLIRNEWLMGVVVPFNSNGNIRCEKAEIIGVVE